MNAIRFCAATAYNNEYGTRVEYSGLDENGGSIVSTSRYERIDWVAGSDRIRILCEAAGNGPTADYAIAGTPTASSAKSSAGIASVAENGLQWGDGDHYFYAMYPAPGMSSNYGFSDNNPVLESKARLEAAAGNKATLTGVIPAAQEAILPEGSHEFKANMNYAYMYAATKVSEGQDGEVTLAFKPLVTTFEFTFLTPGDAPLGKLTSVSLKSASTPLSGTFSAIVSASGLEEVTTQDTGNEVSVTLPGGGVELSSEDAYKVTLLTLPVAQTGLTLTLNFEGGVKRTLELKDNGTFITVGACRKVYIRNLGVPGAVWVYTIDPLQPVTLGYEGGSGQLSKTTTFRSIRTKGNVTEEVPYTLQYSEDNGATWIDGLPDWLHATSPSSYGGSTTGETLTLSMEGQDDHAENVHRAALLANEAKTDFDLSTINVRTGQTVATTTANCYVVQAPGTYKLPLVYGNALVNGAVNESAFRAREGVGGAWRADGGTDIYLGRFTDHLDAYITSPYISTQHSGKTLTAELLWQDVKSLVTDVAISGSGTGAYLTFSVPEENIFQGNALVAVKANGKVAWSWHIWVTDADLTVLTEVSDSYMMPQYNLGWREVRNKNFPAREVMVRAVQHDPSGTSCDAVNVVQTDHVVTIPRYCTFYQWGRKDPIWPSITRGEIFDTNGNPLGGSALLMNSSTLGTGIQRAAWILRRVNGDLYSWCSTVYDNCWDSTYDGNHTSPAVVTKTIYDPSPVGFKIPPHTAYSGFSVSTFTWDPTNKGRVYNGLFFPANGYRHYERMILTDLSTSGYYWTATPEQSNQTAKQLRFFDPGIGNVSIWSTYLANGFSVRPVADTE